MKVLEMGESCSTHGGGKRGLCEVLVQQWKENSHSDDLIVHERLIWRRILKK
jgi:hypothetical protein